MAVFADWERILMLADRLRSVYSANSARSGSDFSATTLDPATSHPNAALSNGNLAVSYTVSDVYANARSIAKITGKVYFEGTRFGGNSPATIGICTPLFNVAGGAFPGDDAQSWVFRFSSFSTFKPRPVHKGYVGRDYGEVPWDSVYMFAVDPVAGTLWVGMNGIWTMNGADPANGVNPSYTGIPAEVYALASAWDSPYLGKNNKSIVNFGASPFVYTPPVGFV